MLSAAPAAFAQNPNPPTAVLNGPSTGTVGVQLSFDGTASFDLDGHNIVAFAWDFGGPGMGMGTTTATPTFTYAAAGNYTVTLTVTDDGVPPLSSPPAGIPVTINDPPNVPPTANPGGPYSGTAGIPVLFDGSGSSDSDGNIASYAWNFGGMGMGGTTGPTPSFTYDAPGTYTVTLTVTDDDGASDSASTTADIVAANVPPTANPGGPYSGTAGIPVLFDGSGSSDSDGNIASYAWNFGGMGMGGTTGPTPSFTYDAPGTYTVTLTVTDDGVPALSDTATTTADIVAANTPPVAVPDTYSTPEGTQLNVTAPGVLGNDTDVEDGTPPTAELVSGPTIGTLLFNNPQFGAFVYTPNAGVQGGPGVTDSFTYRALDSEGLPSAPTTVTINITFVNDPPVAANDGPYNTDEDTTLSVTAAQGVLANDTDPDPGDDLDAVLQNNVNNGTLNLNSETGAFTYTPDPNFSGQDSFTYVAQDSSNVNSAQATVTINVASVNDPPTGSVPDQPATENVPFLLNVAGFFTDPENDLPITFGFSGLPDGLTATTGGIVSGMPALETSVGVSTVQVTATDSLSAQSQTQFDINVVMGGRADLSLSISATPGPALINDPVAWNFEVQNQSIEMVGNFAIDATFSGQVPFTLTDAPGCTVTPLGGETELRCLAGPVEGSGSATVSVTGSSTQAGDVLAFGTVSITDFVPIEQNPEDDSAGGALNVAQSLSAAPAQKLIATSNLDIASGDLDGDGFAEAVVATAAGNSTLVYPNAIDPNDPNAIKRALADQPLTFGSQGAVAGVAIADLNGDGALDIVTANGAGQANQLLLNQNLGVGGFGFDIGPAELGDAADVSNAVTVADVNGDMLPDVVFGNASPNHYYANQGGAVFDSPISLGDAQSVDVLLVNLFGDALPELVVANADGDSEFYANSGGSFLREPDLSTGPATSVAAGDFDGDGDFDLVFGRDEALDGVPSNLIFINTSMNGTGSFFTASALGASPTVDVLALDIDADLDIDIVSVNATGGHQIYVNDGNGQFSLHPQLFSSAGPLAATENRFSLDTRMDVAVVGAGGSDVFFNDGLGNLGLGDTGLPVIQRNGSATVSLDVEADYVDAGAIAMDTIDGDLSADIVVDNPVDTAVIGTYTVTYNVTDSSGNAAVPLTRTVEVGVRTGTGGGGGSATGVTSLAFLLLVCLLRLSGRGFARRES